MSWFLITLGVQFADLIFIFSLAELDQMLEDAPLPFIMQHAAKISSVRKRVSSLNSLLKSIQGRIDNIDRMISIGTTHGIDMSPETLFYGCFLVTEYWVFCFLRVSPLIYALPLVSLQFYFAVQCLDKIYTYKLSDHFLSTIYIWKVRAEFTSHCYIFHPDKIENWSMWADRTYYNFLPYFTRGTSDSGQMISNMCCYMAGICFALFTSHYFD